MFQMYLFCSFFWDIRHNKLSCAYCNYTHTHLLFHSKTLVFQDLFSLVSDEDFSHSLSSCCVVNISLDNLHKILKKSLYI